MGNLGGVLQSTSRPTSLTHGNVISPVITTKIRAASLTLSNHALFRRAFLDFFVSGKWVNEFLDSNPNLLTIHRILTDSPTSKQTGGGMNQAPRMLLELFQAENDALVKSPRVSGVDQNKKELDVEWVTHLPHPETIYAIFLAASYPIFLQSKEFNFWLERREDDSDSDVMLRRNVEMETTEFRANDAGIEDNSNDEYDEKSISYHTEVSLQHYSRHSLASSSSSTHQQHVVSSHSTSSHSQQQPQKPQPKSLKFCHRRKSMSYSEKMMRRADRRRIRIIVQKLLRSLQNASYSSSPTIVTSNTNNSTSMINTTDSNNTNNINKAVSRVMLDTMLSESKAWHQALRQFLDDLPIPVIISRAKDPKFMSTFATLAKSQEASFTILYVNKAYETFAQCTASEVCNRSFVDVVLKKSVIVSRTNGDLATYKPTSSQSKTNNNNSMYGIAERSSLYGAPDHLVGGQGEDYSMPPEEPIPDTYVTMQLESPIVSKPVQDATNNNNTSNNGANNCSEHDLPSVQRSMLILKPVHHVLAHPEYHYLVTVQYDLDCPPILSMNINNEVRSNRNTLVSNANSSNGNSASNSPTRFSNSHVSTANNSNTNTPVCKERTTSQGHSSTSVSVSISGSPRHSLTQLQNSTQLAFNNIPSHTNNSNMSYSNTIAATPTQTMDDGLMSNLMPLDSLDGEMLFMTDNHTFNNPFSSDLGTSHGNSVSNSFSFKDEPILSSNSNQSMSNSNFFRPLSVSIPVEATSMSMSTPVPYNTHPNNMAINSNVSSPGPSSIARKTSTTLFATSQQQQQQAMYGVPVVDTSSKSGRTDASSSFSSSMSTSFSNRLFQGAVVLLNPHSLLSSAATTTNNATNTNNNVDNNKNSNDLVSNFSDKLSDKFSDKLPPLASDKSTTHIQTMNNNSNHPTNNNNMTITVYNSDKLMRQKLLQFEKDVPVLEDMLNLIPHMLY